MAPGLSGGIDSAVTLSLAVKALGSHKVTGLIMPFALTESVDLARNHAKDQRNQRNQETDW